LHKHVANEVISFVSEPNKIQVVEYRAHPIIDSVEKEKRRNVFEVVVVAWHDTAHSSHVQSPRQAYKVAS